MPNYWNPAHEVKRELRRCVCVCGGGGVLLVPAKEMERKSFLENHLVQLLLHK